MFFTGRGHTWESSNFWKGWYLLLFRAWGSFNWPCFTPWQVLAGWFPKLSANVFLFSFSVFLVCIYSLLELPTQNSGADSSLLFQKFNSFYPQLSNFGSEVELNDVRETIQQLLRWGWKYNKNLEEQAAQLHMLTGWSQIVEVAWFIYFIFLDQDTHLILLIYQQNIIEYQFYSLKSDFRLYCIMMYSTLYSLIIFHLPPLYACTGLCF